MRHFDYSFLKTDPIPSEVISFLVTIEKSASLSSIFKNQMPSVFDLLIKIAKIQSVKASNAIEGIVTTDERLKALMEESTEPRNHDEQEILGYRNALNLIHSDYSMIDVRQSDILGLHSLMLAPRGASYRGQFKTTDNVVLEIQSNGLRRIRFAPTPAKDTPQAMEQLELAFFVARQDASISKLLLIPCYILDFLCVHPFSDGNGRMSRLLSLLLLYKEGYDIGKYVSFEHMINENKDSYYDALQKSSRSWHENKNSYWPFVLDFLQTLLACYQDIQKRQNILKDRRLSKAERIRETIFTTLGAISKEEIHLLWPDISITTIEKELGRLTKEGSILKTGNTNGAKYYRK